MKVSTTALEILMRWKWKYLKKNSWYKYAMTLQDQHMKNFINWRMRIGNNLCFLFICFVYVFCIFLKMKRENGRKFVDNDLIHFQYNYHETTKCMTKSNLPTNILGPTRCHALWCKLVRKWSIQAASFWVSVVSANGSIMDINVTSHVVSARAWCCTCFLFRRHAPDAIYPHTSSYIVIQNAAQMKLDPWKEVQKFNVITLS